VHSKSVVKTIEVNTHGDEVEDKLSYPLLCSVIFRGSKILRCCSTNSVQRLEGLCPAAEYWHTKVVVLK